MDLTATNRPRLETPHEFSVELRRRAQCSETFIDNNRETSTGRRLSLLRKDCD